MSTKKTVTLDKKKSPSKQLAKKLKDKYAANSRKDELNKKLLENHKLKNVMIPLQKKNVSLQEKQKRIEEKLKEREKRKEEKARLAEYMKEWNRHREDLELEDLKVLPMPSVINCGIPDEHFGDFVMILEFFQSFRDILSLKSFFPGGVVSFEVMVRALVTKEVAGPLSDMIQMLLQTLFNMQEEEDDEILETNNLNTDVGLDMEKIGDVTTSEAMKAATAVVNWSQLSQGTPLNKLSLDAVALSEVLRLHLLSSGGRSGELSSKWRYQQRGGYTSLDDPGLQLRIEHPHILRALSITSVCELPLGDKVKVLTCLINQILTYAVVRDVIDERGDKMKQIKADLKAMQVAESKKEREATALRIKEKKEAKLRLAESNPALPNNSAIAPAPPSNIGVEEPEKSSDSKTEEACKLKVEKERLRKKQEWLKKTQDMHQAAMGFQLLPLGLDRGYRRYWLFSSLSGLFVENDERFPGVCLSKATPCDPNLARLDDTVSYVRKLFEEERNCGSDKENDVCEVGTNRSGQVLSPSKKLLAESGLTVLNVRSPVQLDVKAEPISEESKLQPPLLVCTTNRSTCPVHSSGMSRTKWAYFSTEEEIVSLIKSLNKRGVRESDLRRTLIQQQERVVMNVKLCPVRKLDKSLPDEDSEQRKSTRAVKVPKYDDSNLGFPTDMAVETVLNLFLRDSILQLEDKIEMGGLGSLQWVPISLFYSILISPPSVVPRDPSNPVEFGLNPGQVETRDRRLVDKFGTGSGQLAPRRYNSTDNIPVEKLRYEESTSRSTTPILELVKNDPARSLTRQDSLTQQPVMRNLASAILQVAQSVGAKYMQKPLGPDESPDEKQTVWPAMERWETSLMASTSFAQLFLHLFTLDNSIQWSKSALNAHCRICRGRRDPENMLLCDGCNKGHHLYCLKPKLSKIPAGDWFCHKCRPKDKVRTPKKSRRLFSEESDQEEIAEDKSVVTCSKCGFEGRLAHCEGCSRYFHKKCIVPYLKKIHKHWMCTDCVPKESSPKSSKRKVISGAVESPEPKQRRCSASAAVLNISKYAKQLQRSDSWNDDGAINDEDDDYEDEEMQPSRRSHRRSQVLDQSLPLDNAILQDLLMELIHHKDAWPFLRPVQKAQVPDYHLIIKRPMDFGRIKNKLNMLVYVHNSEFIADTLLVFENCQMYNQSEAEEYKAGARMSRFFRKRCRQLGLQIPDEANPPPAKKPRLSS
uniref:Bromodomain adjacent to zinc finger domain protein 1A n=2 Tax=Timema TaxID=61471 RepID=A0A7R9IG91_9NEOP|nr:unnamed protein product [Timema tahoe]